MTDTPIPKRAVEDLIDVAPCPDQPPDGWVEVAFFPRQRYYMLEDTDGWHTYVPDDHGAFT